MAQRDSLYDAPEVKEAKDAAALYAVLLEHYNDNARVMKAWNDALLAEHRAYHIEREPVVVDAALPWLAKGWEPWSTTCPERATLVRSDGSLSTGRVLHIGRSTVRIEFGDGWIQKGVGYALVPKEGNAGAPRRCDDGT